MKKVKKIKTTIDLNPKHFSRYGEFLVSFELSKRGWNVYNPVYDEYIDFIIHKHVCIECCQKWQLTPVLVCRQYGKDFSKTQKTRIIAKKICLFCGSQMIGNKTQCVKCQNKNILNKPTCDKCEGEVEMIEHTCQCGSRCYITKYRSVQVKSSRIEFDEGTGKTKNTHAIDMKPRDFIKDPTHYYIWCLVDNNDKPHFIVLSVKDFVKTMGDSLKGISFLKDQDRQHFSALDFGKWKKHLNRFEKLE